MLRCLGAFKLVAPGVESSIAVEDAVENRGLYRVFVSRLFSLRARILKNFNLA